MWGGGKKKKGGGTGGGGGHASSLAISTNSCSLLIFPRFNVTSERRRKGKRRSKERRKGRGRSPSRDRCIGSHYLFPPTTLDCVTTEEGEGGKGGCSRGEKEGKKEKRGKKGECATLAMAAHSDCMPLFSSPGAPSCVMEERGREKAGGRKERERGRKGK